MATLGGPLAETDKFLEHVQKRRHVMPAVMTSRLAAELDYAFERNGFTAEEVKILSSGDILGLVRGVLRGTHEIANIERNIDFSNPGKIEGARHKSHSGPMGICQLVKDGNHLFLGGQKIILRPFLVGRSDRVQLEDDSPIGSALINYLVDHPEIWPSYFKDGNKVLRFEGDIFEDLENGSEHVRCCYWKDGPVAYHLHYGNNGNHVMNHARGDTIPVY